MIDDVLGRARLANSMHLMECTDDELRELMLRREPGLDRAALMGMHKEEMVAQLLK